MNTETASRVPVENYKRTKIIATLGPVTNSYEAIEKLIQCGVNGLRLNFSHGDYEERKQQIEWIRKASKALSKPVAIIQDLQGPKIRLGDFEGMVTVQEGQELRFSYKSNYAETGIVPLQYDLSKKVRRGDRLYLYDGKVHTVVTSVKDSVISVRADNEGFLVQRKGINLPDTDFGGDVITKKDRADIVFGSTQDIDYVALSFVQTPDDITNLRKLLKGLGSSARVIAKIETKAAVDNIEAIITETDVIMIARGDLAVEVPPESVPIIQRQIIGLGLQYVKPTIVATEILASMVESPDPTRAEVSDVASAVIVGADCLMLSDETAVGRYPLEAVRIMKRIIVYTEAHAPLKVQFPQPDDQSKQAAISNGIISLATSIRAKAIVAETKSGATALQIMTHRPDISLIAVTGDKRVAQQLAIVYGVKSYVRPVHRLAATRLTDWLREQKILNSGDIIVTASGRYPGVVGTTDTIKVRVLE